MDSLIKDIRYGVRNLLKRPGFALIAAITLGLGIGANSAIFSVVNSVLLKPLRFPESEQIAVLEGVNAKAGITASNMSVPDLVDWQAGSHSFQQLVGFVTGGSILTSGDETERVRGTDVTADFFPLFRTNAALGRTLVADDAKKGQQPVVVLSHSLWQRRFGGNKDVVGTKIILGRTSTTIVGVMPAGFDFPEKSELWAPFELDASAERRDNRYVNVIARLKPGVSPAQAQTDLNVINQRLADTYHDTNSGWTVKVTNLREQMVGSMRLSLLVLLGAVAFVLLIACANVANLLLARATVRAKEMALRSALGATRGRIIRQLLTESMLLSMVGGIGGILLSIWLTRVLVAISPADSPRFEEIAPDSRVLLFTVGLTLLTGLVFGLAPALQSSRTDLNERLKEGGRSGSGGARHNRMRSLMMVSEVALSFMLLVGAGLLIKSFIRLRDVSPGFNAGNLLTLRMSAGKYASGEPRTQFFNQSIQKLRSLPGVQGVAAVLSLPLGGDTFNVGRSYLPEGRPATPEQAGNASYEVITPEYFRTMQIPLLKGRTFSDQDTNQSSKVVIVNETMAGRLWPGENPVGRRLTIWRDEQFPREIVGIVGDVKASLDSEVGPQMYVPYAQEPGWSSLSFVIRTNSDPLLMPAAVRNEMKALDKEVPLYNVKSMDEVLATSVAPRRTPMLLLSGFAALALLLAMIGIYGVTSYYVTQRTQEIGIRMALGAEVRDVMALVLRGGMVLAVVGIALGLAGALALTRLLSSLLFGVKPTDVLTFAAVAVCLLLTALLACLLPARRATRVDPLVALRYE